MSDEQERYARRLFSDSHSLAALLAEIDWNQLRAIRRQVEFETWIRSEAHAIAINRETVFEEELAKLRELTGRLNFTR